MFVSEKKNTIFSGVPRAAQQFNGREGETATLL
jgi:hypothetical protein